MRLEKRDREVLMIILLAISAHLVIMLTGGWGCVSCNNPITIPDLESLSFWVVTAVALVDSVNPCALSTLLFLFTILMASGGREKALRISMSFIFSSYFTYLLFGLGAIALIDISGLSFVFHKAVSILSIFLGFAHIRDWYGDVRTTEVPFSWRPKIANVLRRVDSLGAALLAGFVVTLFEFPCTGGPYALVLGLLSHSTTQGLVIPILLYYNLIFVLPLVMVSLLMYLGVSEVEELEDFKARNRRTLHLVSGLVLVLLGIYLSLA